MTCGLGEGTTHHFACDCREEMFRKLRDYVGHKKSCILNLWEAGEPTLAGGYQTKYAGVWYQSKPVDETPKCTCGLDDILKATTGHSPEGKTL